MQPGRGNKMSQKLTCGNGSGFAATQVLHIGHIGFNGLVVILPKGKPNDSFTHSFSGCFQRALRFPGGCSHTHTGLRTYGHYSIAGKDRKSTRLNSSHVRISYAVFCLKKKKTLCSTRTRSSN